MAREGNYWSVFIEGALVDSLYKFRIKNTGIGSDQHAVEQYRHDPYARDAVSYAGNSVVVDRSFDWSGDHFRIPPWNELIVYELHIGTFAKLAAGHVATLNDAIGKLDHVAGLGFNAVQVLPAFDFQTETSMGYNTALPFAIDNAYGELQTMKRFIKEAHTRGLAVILDVVYNHWGNEGLEDCLGKFDGWYKPNKQGIYFYDDYRSKTSYGEDCRPDYGRGDVRLFIRDNAMTALEEFHADGLRLDSTIAMRRVKCNDGDLGDLPDGWTLLRYLGEEKRRLCPHKIIIAEDLQNDASITRDALFGGLGMDADWDGWYDDRLRSMLLASSDDSRRASRIKEAIEKSYNSAGAFQRQMYFCSHDGALHHGRIPDLVAPGDSDGWLARKIAALGIGLLMTSAGIPMIFMGDEFLEWKRWSDGRDSFMDWDRLRRFPGFADLVRRLCRLRRNWENNTRGLRGDRTWVYHASDNDGVLAFLRQQGDGQGDWGKGDTTIVTVNLRNRIWPSYNIGLPNAGIWYLRFNSDWQGYCSDFSNIGSNTTGWWGANQGMPANGNVSLGPYSVCIYSQ
jgi:1,4-alpha-glucan branching enzyme